MKTILKEKLNGIGQVKIEKVQEMQIQKGITLKIL